MFRLLRQYGLQMFDGFGVVTLRDQALGQEQAIGQRRGVSNLITNRLHGWTARKGPEGQCVRFAKIMHFYDDEIDPGTHDREEQDDPKPTRLRAPAVTIRQHPNRKRPLKEEKD